LLSLWSSVSVACFYNDDKSPFRTQLAWWKDFQNAKSTDLIKPYDELAARIFPRNIYGMPDAYWKHLEETGVDTLLIVGVEADASIIKISMDAFDRGLAVFVAPHFICSTYGQQGVDVGIHVLSKTLGNDHLLTVGESSSMFGSLVS